MTLTGKNSMRSFLLAGIVAITTSALFAIIVVLMGTWSEFEVRVVATTLVIGYFALTTAATFGEGEVHTILGTVGVILGGLGLLITLPIIWSVTSVPEIWQVKMAVVLAILAFSFAHASINIRLSTISVLSVGVMIVVNVVIAALALMLIHIVLFEAQFSDVTIRSMIALAIADVALTILNPIVARLTKVSATA